MKRPRKPREGSESRAARRRLKAADGGRREQLGMGAPARAGGGGRHEQLAKRSPQPTASAKGALSPEGSCVGFRCGVSGSYMTAWLADCMR